MKIRIAVFATIILALGVTFWYAVHTGDDHLSPKELKALGFASLAEPKQIEELDLVDHTGASFGPSNLEGKWTYAFFGFTHCPNICSETMSLLQQTEQRLSETLSPEVFASFQGMFVSVDPARDDVKTVGEFVSYFSPNFVGLTGSETAIRQFADTVGVGYERMETNTSALDYLVDHQGHIVVFSPAGSCIGYIKQPHELTQLARIFRYLAISSKERQDSSS